MSVLTETPVGSGRTNSGPGGLDATGQDTASTEAGNGWVL